LQHHQQEMIPASKQTLKCKWHGFFCLMLLLQMKVIKESMMRS
jgi:hypothetical protein